VFEDSVKRELWEEAGVKVWDIKYHSSQPWVSKHKPLPWITRSTIAFSRAALPSKPHGRVPRQGQRISETEGRFRQRAYRQVGRVLASPYVDFLIDFPPQTLDGSHARKSSQCSTTLRGQISTPGVTPN